MLANQEEGALEHAACKSNNAISQVIGGDERTPERTMLLELTVAYEGVRWVKGDKGQNEFYSSCRSKALRLMSHLPLKE